MLSFVMLRCEGRACRCESCGYVASVRDDRQFTSHICHGVASWFAPPVVATPGLGDRVASALSAVGITEARAQAVAKAVGLKDCGCGRRRAAMNRLGEKLGLPLGSTAAS